MKNKVKLIMFLFFGLTSLVYIFPFAFVEAAKLESGVTINAPPPTTDICPDANIDGNNDDTGEPCPSTLAPTVGTCGLLIMDGVPINYGALNLGQDSPEQIVEVRNEGNSAARIMIKGGDWINDDEADPYAAVSGPEITHVAIAPNLDWSNKKALSSGGWELGVISGGQTIPVYFQFKVPINAPSGSFHQDVTIDLLC